MGTGITNANIPTVTGNTPESHVSQAEEVLFNLKKI